MIDPEACGEDGTRKYASLVTSGYIYPGYCSKNDVTVAKIHIHDQGLKRGLERTFIVQISVKDTI